MRSAARARRPRAPRADRAGPWPAGSVLAEEGAEDAPDQVLAHPRRDDLRAGPQDLRFLALVGEGGLLLGTLLLLHLARLFANRPLVVRLAHRHLASRSGRGRVGIGHRCGYLGCGLGLRLGRLDPGGAHLVGALAIDRRAVLGTQRSRGDHLLELALVERTEEAGWRDEPSGSQRRGDAPGREDGHERLS